MCTMSDGKTRAALAQTCQLCRLASKSPNAIVSTIYDDNAVIPDWVRPLCIVRKCTNVTSYPGLQTIYITPDRSGACKGASWSVAS